MYLYVTNVENLKFNNPLNSKFKHFKRFYFMLKIIIFTIFMFYEGKPDTRSQIQFVKLFKSNKNIL